MSSLALTMASAVRVLTSVPGIAPGVPATPALRSTWPMVSRNCSTPSFSASCAIGTVTVMVLPIPETSVFAAKVTVPETLAPGPRSRVARLLALRPAPPAESVRLSSGLLRVQGTITAVSGFTVPRMVISNSTFAVWPAAVTLSSSTVPLTTEADSVRSASAISA